MTAAQRDDSFGAVYRTPDGFDDLLMRADGDLLTGLWFAGSRTTTLRHTSGMVREPLVFRETRRWLDIYFSGRSPDFTPPYRLVGATAFRGDVVREMLKIPFGATVTYGDIARNLCRCRRLRRMSARAVGGAVGWNPICLIIPCHRVVGAGGRLTGYGGGLANKIALLRHERRILL